MNVCPELSLVESFYENADSERICRLLLAEPWPDSRYVVAGRQFVLPRLQTWHADPGIRYSYSNNLLQTRPWTPLLHEIRSKVEAFLNYRFNSVLVNLYRNGDDYVGWHADDETELGEQAFIASVTFGAERRFSFRRKQAAAVEHSLALPSGSLLIMRPGFQRYWQHCMLPDSSVTEARLNLTFRKVIMPETGVGGRPELWPV